MGVLRWNRWRWILIGLFIAGTGCNSQDRNHLTRAAGKAKEKLEALTGDPEGRLRTQWQAVRTDLNEMTLDARVSARLRWDKSLADTDIQVHTSGGIVELSGSVRDLAQRRRAVELAEATVGADKVSDLLEIAEP